MRNDAMTASHTVALEPAPIHVSDEVLDDLRARLALTRPPQDEGNADWSYGVPDSYLRGLVAYWRDGYDWRQAEAAINAYEHYQVSVAGVPVHFMRKPGRGPRPIPLILTHGWPWTFWHWSKVIDPLADPAAFGADPVDAFDVIVPSLPGFGFPGPLTGFPDVNFWKVSDLWHSLMTETLGYEKYAAGGCDIGGIVSSQLGHKYADELYGIHIGSGLPLDFFTGARAWDLARSRPLTEDQPAEVRARMIELDHRSASHLVLRQRQSLPLGPGPRPHAGRGGPGRPHVRHLREPARHPHRQRTRPRVHNRPAGRVVQPRQRQRPRPRRPLHPLGEPRCLGQRPTPHLPRPPTLNDPAGSVRRQTGPNVASQ
jgi:pimeloyl-ACP methyl ester carboxylesterase